MFSFFLYLSLLNSAVVDSKEKLYSANYIFMEQSHFPCLLLSALCCYALYNYLIIKWWRSLDSTACRVLYSCYKEDFLNYQVTPFLRLSLLTLPLCLSNFRRCLSNDPEQPSVYPTPTPAPLPPPH